MWLISLACLSLSLVSSNVLLFAECYTLTAHRLQPKSLETRVPANKAIDQSVR